MKQRAWSSEERRALLDELDSRVNSAGLKELCYELGVQYDNLPGSTKKEKILELILLLERQGYLEKLVKKTDALRPQSASRSTRSTRPANKATPLCGRLEKRDWETLEQAVTKPWLLAVLPQCSTIDSL